MLAVCSWVALYLACAVASDKSNIGCMNWLVGMRDAPLEERLVSR